MINILHTASAPGLRDAMNPVRRRRRLRWRWRRDERPAREGATATPSVPIPRP
jgi:hypothetical protein